MNPKLSSKSLQTWLPIFVAMLAAVFLYGCGVKNRQQAKQAVMPAGQFPIVEEKMTITAFLSAGDTLVEDYQNNDFVRYLEQKTNIQLDLDVSPAGADAAQKRNLLLASGDYPEIFVDGFGKAESQIYGGQGVIIPLNDLIAEYGANTRKILADFPLVKDNLTLPDGKMYNLPTVNECFHCSLGPKLWVYEPWLDKLGLEMPTTIEDFKEMLIAFRDRDPNGNGLKDEIPLSGMIQYGAGIDGFLMRAFIYSQGNLGEGGLGRMYLDNGKITAAFAQPEFKDGLLYMNDLYNEGLIDPDSFVQDINKYLALGENPDTVLMGAGTGPHMGVFTYFNGESGRWLEYKAMPPLEGPNGLRVSRYYPHYGGGAWAITDKAKNPEAALRLGDAFYEEDVLLHNLYGREGIEWAWAETGELGINGLQAIWKALVGRGEINGTSWWNQAGPTIQSAAFRLGQMSKGPEDLETVLFNETKEKMEPYQVDINMIIPPLTYDEEVIAEHAELGSTLGTYVNEMIARFIVGDADIETGWDDYLAELDNIGLPRYIELMQEAYDKR